MSDYKETTTPPASDDSRGSGEEASRSLINTWRRRVHVYWVPLTRNSRPGKIMRRMRITDDSPVLDEIVDLDSDNKSIEASEKFLTFLKSDDGLSLIEVAARWSLFEQALKEVHPYLYDTVNGKCEAETHELQKKLVTFFAEEITASVDPEHILPDIIACDLLGDMEIECMMRITQQKGPTLGAVYMVGHLPRSTNQLWYLNFLKILIKNGYDDLVKKLDDSAYDKLKRSASQPLLLEAMEAVVISGTGEAYVEGSLNYCGAPLNEKGACRASAEGSLNDCGDPSLDYADALGASLEEALNNCGAPSFDERDAYKPQTDKQKKICRVQSMQSSGNGQMAASGPISFESTADDQELTSLKQRAGDNTMSRDENNDDDPDLTSLKRWADGNIKSKDSSIMSNKDTQRQPSMVFAPKNIDTADGTEQSCADNSNVEMEEPRKEGEEGEEGAGTGEDLKLRDYQEELAGPALKGKNVIICAPTGSGKTHVALKIIQDHLKQQDRGVRKVVFLVNQVALAEQQYKQCTTFLKDVRCKRITGNTGDTEKVPLKNLMMGADILVMTCQILLDSLDQKEIEDICQFSLIVLDECHHTNHRHPFNGIMHHYMDVKWSDSDKETQLPQVVGLTASVGVGKAGRQEQALNHIRKLCAHLDVSFICTVNCNVEQLAQFSNEPAYEQFICDKRAVDDFQEKVESMMRQIEEHLHKSEAKAKACTDDKELDAKLQTPRTRGTIQYGGWISQMRKELAKVRDPDARRFLDSCRRMLDFYNTSLIINDECDTADAWKFLCQQIDTTYESIGNRAVQIDTFLKEVFDKNMPYLERVSEQQANSNPKLLKLENLLVKAFRDEPESRAMIFVKTRDLAAALQQWMLRTASLKELKPGKMVGAGPSVDSGGMTKNQQVDVIDYFRDGNRKVMVATSVAEEGLDIRKCNLVIRYNHVTNEIAMVQARGRARAENSKFVTLASGDRGVQAKEEVNFIREMMMREAIKELQVEMRTRSREFRRALDVIQREEKSMRDVEAAQRKGRRKRQFEVEFRCRRCDAYAFMSTDLRLIEQVHHVVIDLEYRDRHVEKPTPSPQAFGNSDILWQGKLLCKTCGEDMGRSILYKNTKFPVPKLEGFVLTDEFDRKDAPKKWKKTNFDIKALEPEELDEYRKKALEAGYTEDD